MRNMLKKMRLLSIKPMIKKLVLLIMLVLTSVVMQVTAEPLTNMMTVSMRDHGYTLGDKVAMQVQFTLAEGQQINPESLPLIGQVKPWLDIAKVDFKQTKSQVDLTIVWQLFGTVEMAQQLKTPKIVLNTQSQPAQQIEIPQQAFYYSPVLPLPPLKHVQRMENVQPPLFDAGKPLLGLVVCAALFVLSALLWAWVKDYLPWLPFKAGPMTKLARKLKAKRQNQYCDLSTLRAVHTALNEAAGVSLYANDLEPLIAKAPYFAAIQTELATFFEDSWQQFYTDVPAPTVTYDSVEAWVQQVAIAERLFRRNKVQ